MIDIEKLAEEYSQRAYDMGDKRLNDKLAFCDGANAMLAENARLKEQAEKLALAINSLAQQFDWYANQFAGWDERAHEFEHWWRVEAPQELDQALAEYRREFKPDPRG